MNITDVDDKIILRARQNYLFDQYSKENINNTKKFMLTLMYIKILLKPQG